MQPHLTDIAKVGAANGVAVGLSIVDINSLLSAAATLAALIYSCIKIAQALRDWNRSKPKS